MKCICVKYPCFKPFRLPEGFLFPIYSGFLAFHNGCTFQATKPSQLYSRLLNTIKPYNYEKDSIHRGSFNYARRTSCCFDPGNGKVIV